MDKPGQMIKNPNLHYTHGNTPKRVTSGRLIRTQLRRNVAPVPSRWQFCVRFVKLLTPIAMSSTNALTGRRISHPIAIFRVKYVENAEPIQVYMYENITREIIESL